MSRPVFRNYGRIDQLQIETLEDLERLETLDRARWAATSAPCEHLCCDPAVLAFIDTDHNGRIRVNDLKEARRWLWERLAHRERVIEGADTLFLADLNPEQTEAGQVRALSLRLLEQLEAPSRDRISLEQVRRFKREYVRRFPNGDGVVSLAQIADPAVAAVAASVMAGVGGAPDLGGDPGVRADDIDAWLAQVAAYAAGSARATQERELLAPLGEDTAQASALVAALEPKMTQFYAQCALVALESAANARLQATPEDLARLDVRDPVAIDAWLMTAPLARPSADGVLALDGPCNPRFAPDLDRLAADIGPRALRREGPLTRLTAVEWSAIRAVFRPFQDWIASRPAGVPPGADPAALQALAAGPARETLQAMVLEDRRVADELVAFNALERVILYQRWLLILANNFVSFPDLFNPQKRSLLERGTLIIDGRKLLLTVRVTDIAAHKKLAESSLMFLAYVELVRKDEAGEERKETIAAAVTAGERGAIAVGKRGVFYDRDEHEWDAVVMDVIVQPISIWEAMISPFVRMRDHVVARLTAILESEANAAESSVTEAATRSTEQAVTPGRAPPPAPKAAGDTPARPAASNTLQTLLVSGSFAFAAIGSSTAFIAGTVNAMGAYNALYSVFTMVLSLAGLFGLLGWLKLRRRDIAALLEACGWAMNSRMRMTRHLSEVFTLRPGLPPGAIRKVQVPRGALRWSLFLLLLVAGAATWVYTWRPAWLAPAEATPAPVTDPVSPPVE